MSMFFDSQGQLLLEPFAAGVRAATRDLALVLHELAQTHAGRVESTHFLLALMQIPGGFAGAIFKDAGLGMSDLDAGLRTCINASPHAAVPTRLSRDILDDTARQVIDSLERLLATGAASQVDEAQVLRAVLENLSPPVVQSLADVRISPHRLLANLDRLVAQVQSYVPPQPFIAERINLDAFSSGGRRVVLRMQREAEDLDFPEMDPRHLLLALVGHKGGATQGVLYQQEATPARVQEALSLNLRGRGNRTRSRLALERRFVSESLARIIDQASAQAQADRSEHIAEVHLLRGFLAVETFALRLLTSCGLDLAALRQGAGAWAAGEEAEQDEASVPPSLEAVKATLRAALVGQQEAVETCLRFIARLLFGFRQLGKPAGVFLFCGPSGVGKTELAKAMARAVFGSEESLLMLEMGQFQTKESMNIFVGASPGYVGYGEGKLTNGLRERPRSVVLFDEVEKAHPEVFDAVLRFIDEGRIQDPAGPTRDGSECIIVMTSNVSTDGLDQLVQGDSQRQNRWEIRGRLKDALVSLPAARKAGSGLGSFRFRQEFLNRIDEIVLFRQLAPDDLRVIAQRHMQGLFQRLQDEKQVQVAFCHGNEELAKTLETAATAVIADFCAKLKEGARATFRVTTQAVLDPVIDFLSEHRCMTPVSLDIQVQPDRVTGEPRGIVNFASPGSAGVAGA